MSGRPVKDSGAINFVSLFLVLLVVGAAYLAWVYGPVYIDYFGVKKAVKVACNHAYRDRSDKAVRDSIMQEWGELKVEDGILNDDGSISKTATPFDRSENIDVSFEKDPPSVTVAVHYTQHLVFPFIKKERDLDFDYSHTEDLQAIKY